MTPADISSFLTNPALMGPIEQMLRRAIGGGGGDRTRRNEPQEESPSQRRRTGGTRKSDEEDYKNGIRGFTQLLLDSNDATRSFSRRVNDLEKATENFGNKYLDGIVTNLLKVNTGIGEAANRLDDEIKDLNVQDLFNTLGEFSAAVDESAASLAKFGKDTFEDVANVAAVGVYGLVEKTDKSYQNLLVNGSKFISNLTDDSKKILENLENGIDATTDELKKLGKEIDQATRETKKYTEIRLKQLREEVAQAGVKKGLEDATMKALGINSLKLMGWMGLLGVGLKGAYNDFRKVASAGLAGHFTDITFSAARLGISVEKMTEIYRSNARGLAMGMGPAFADSISAGQNGLFALGLGLEEAAVGANGFYKNAISSGLNPRQTDKLNDSIKFQTDAFKDLRSVTGATIEEFNSMNESMAQNIDNMTLSLRFAPQERNARFQELISLRNEFAMRGLSAKAADSMVTAMQGFSKNTMKDRYEAAAKLQQAAGLMGMGAQGQRMAELSRKRNRSDSEAAELLSMSGELKGRMAQFGNAGPLAENLVDVLDEGMNGAAKGLMEAGVQLKLAADAQMGITKGQLKAEGKKNELSKGTAAGLMTLDMAVNILNSSLGKILIAVIGLGVSSAMGGAKGLIDLVKNLFPKLAGLFSGGIGGMISKLTGLFTGGIGGITGAFTGMIGRLAGLFDAGVRGITGAFTGMISKLTGLFTRMISKLAGLFSGGIGGMISKLTGLFTGGIGGGAGGFISKLLQFAKIGAKAFGVVGIVVSLFEGLYDTFTKFGDVLKFDSFGGLLKSLGVLGLQMLSSIGQLIMRIPEFFVDALAWLLDGLLPKSWIDGLKNASKALGDARSWIDDFFDSVTGGLLKFGRTDEEKKKVDENTARIKADKEAAKAAKTAADATEKHTKAVAKSAEEYLGVVNGPISARDLTNGNTSVRTESVDNSQSKDNKGTPPPINNQGDTSPGVSPVPGTPATSSASSSKPATLDDILKKLEEICAATIEDTDKVTTVLARLQPSKFGGGPGLRLS